MRPILVFLLATGCVSAADNVLARVATHVDRFSAISRQIWETPELGFHETKSSAAFAKALQELRRKRSISQEQLGFESGYHRTYISMLERGKMNPSLRTVLSLATALNISAAEIVARVERLLGSPWQRPQNP